MSGVGAGYRVTEAAFDPGQGGVPEPMGADLLGGHPGQVATDARPHMVVAAGGDRRPGAVPQKLPARWGVPTFGMVFQVRHQGGRNGLPPGHATFFVQQDQALIRVEIAGAQR